MARWPKVNIQETAGERYSVFWAWLKTELPDCTVVDEYKFALPKNQYRFDFAILEWMIAIEIEGGLYGKDGRKCNACKQPIGGAHRTVAGITRDIRKYNLAQLKGWIVIRLEPNRLVFQKTLDMIKEAINLRANPIPLPLSSQGGQRV